MYAMRDSLCALLKKFGYTNEMMPEYLKEVIQNVEQANL